MSSNYLPKVLLLHSVLIGYSFIHSTSLVLPILIVSVALLSMIPDLKVQQQTSAFIPTILVFMYDPYSGFYFGIWLLFTFLFNTYSMIKPRSLIILSLIFLLSYLVFTFTFIDNIGYLIGYGYFLGRSVGINTLLNSKGIKDFNTIANHSLGILLSIVFVSTIYNAVHPWTVPVLLYGILFSILRTYHSSVVAIDIKTNQTVTEVNIK